VVTRECVIAKEGGKECEPSECLAQSRCPEKVKAMKRMLALLSASRKVREGQWIRGAPTHVLADLMGELEKSGWTLVNEEEGVE
jgi:hypothetical protein